MKKGIQTRLLSHEILFLLRNSKLNFDEVFKSILLKNKISESDKKMIHNIVLSSMRFNIHIKKILSIYVKKKIEPQQFILFLSSITQIIFLDFKDYAVVNSTVELSKNKKINVNPGFVNAVLKKIAQDKNKLKKTIISFKDFPKWFQNETKDITKNKKNYLLKSIVLKPKLHLVFKKDIPSTFKKIKLYKTTNKSCYILEPLKVENIPDYENGKWWVQDFSSMMPLHLINNFKNKKVIDLCAAPGGKSFQLLSLGAKLDIVEINPKRSEILKINLKRLNYNNNIIVGDALEVDQNKKYDYVIIDAPCSSVGTITKNPEILFRNSKPNFDFLLKKQQKLLDKASKILNKKGYIIYMVCSFLNIETNLQINNFLSKNKNFSIEKFVLDDKIKDLIRDNKCLKFIPQNTNNINIEGFFAVKLKKND